MKPNNETTTLTTSGFKGGINVGDIVCRAGDRRDLSDKILAFVLAVILSHRLSRTFWNFVKYEPPIRYTITEINDSCTITVRAIDEC